MQMWPSLIRQAKEGGIDVIQTYVFWNLHEPQPGQVTVHISYASHQRNWKQMNNEQSWERKLMGVLTVVSGSFCVAQFDFSGRHDLVGFIKEIQAQGLYACLRIGPFVEAEWAYGYASLST